MVVVYNGMHDGSGLGPEEGILLKFVKVPESSNFILFAIPRAHLQAILPVGCT